MQIRDVMTEHVTRTRPDADLGSVARIMRDEGIGAVPVEDNDRLVGMITDRDIVVRAIAEGADPSSTRVREAMSPRILYCMEDESVEDVLHNMGEQQVRRLPVVNRQKRLVGIVSLADLSGQARLADTAESLRDISSPASLH